MCIKKDYKEHGYVQKKDKGFVFIIEGVMNIDYPILVEIYLDDFWKNYSYH